MKELLQMLDEAMSVARGKGHEVTGWTIQQNDGEYVAWLHCDVEDGQVCLFTDMGVETSDTLEEAVLFCAEAAERLPQYMWEGQA